MTANCDIAMPMVDAALRYRDAGLSPIATQNKAFVGQSWKPFQSALATVEQLGDQFINPRAEQVAIICGAVSGNLECLDFDLGGAAWPEYESALREDCPGLLERLVMETTPSGGRHLLYRVLQKIPVGSPWAKRLVNDKWEVLIETRGTSQYFCCSPSPGYELVQGDLTETPVITPEERECLIRTARALDERPETIEKAVSRPADERGASETSGRPGDDFNHRGDVRALLQRHGWQHLRTIGPNEHWRRPGKSVGGLSATLRDIDGVSVFYVFSSSTPFEAGRAYSPYQVYATLEHGGDFAAAAAALRRQGHGEERAAAAVAAGATANDEPEFDDSPPESESTKEPCPEFSESLLHVPGFMGRVMEHNLATAHRPQPILALAGALALQATLAARQLADNAGTRTNLYILGLADSGCGKERARESNDEILTLAGMEKWIAPEEIASDSGLISELSTQPVMLFQGDEIGLMLKQLLTAKGDHLKAIPSLLMKLYTKSAGVYRGKAYADTSRRKTLEYPCLTIYGTSVPDNVYEGLSPESLQDGFFGRLTIFESTERPNLIEGVVKRPPPDDVIAVAKWWGAKYDQVLGNLTNFTFPDATRVPTPRIVRKTDQAQALYRDAVADIEKTIASWDPVESSLWSRYGEKATKFALCYAASCDHENPVINEAAIGWGCALAEYTTRKMVYDASRWVAVNSFDREQKSVLRFIESEGGTVPAWKLNRKMRHLAKRPRDELVENMIATGQIKVETAKTGGTQKRIYVLR